MRIETLMERDAAAKVSPAFRPLLAQSKEHEKHEAIVIYRTASTVPPVRGRLRALKKRLDAIKAEQRPVQAKLLSDYQEEGSKRLPKNQSVEVSAIGDNTLPAAWVEVTRSSLPALAAQPNVVAVLPNLKIHLIQPKGVAYESASPQEKKDGLTWGLKQLGVPELWKTTQGKDINVAVLDTGVHGDHPALAGRMDKKGFVVIDPLGRRITTDITFDSAQHGTHVCGTIAGGKTAEGVAIGVAPEANLLAGTVLLGGQGNLRMLVEGIAWAVEQGADLISMSLGFSYYEPLFAELFIVLTEQFGVLPVAAIGNSNYGNSDSPGNAHSGLAVGAVEKLPGGKTDVAFFSSGASLVFPGAEPQGLVTKPDVVAPGVQVYSSIPPESRRDGTWEYTYMDGSSMATPHVAGVAALLMAARPTVPARDVMQALKDTAWHPDGKARRPDNRWGYGLIQPVEALKAL